MPPTLGHGAATLESFTGATSPAPAFRLITLDPGTPVGDH